MHLATSRCIFAQSTCSFNKIVQHVWYIKNPPITHLKCILLSSLFACNVDYVTFAICTRVGLFYCSWKRRATNYQDHISIASQLNSHIFDAPNLSLMQESFVIFGGLRSNARNLREHSRKHINAYHALSLLKFKIL